MFEPFLLQVGLLTLKFKNKVSFLLSIASRSELDS